MRASLAIVVVCFSLSGCASQRTVRSQGDIDSLPRSRGLYGGSWIVRPWSYIGSDARYDHFVYTYTSGNLASRVPVRMPKGYVVLGFEPQPYGSRNWGIPVIPKYRDGRLAGFVAEAEGSPNPGASFR